MFDINFILNGSKKPTKKKKSRDPLFDLMIGPKTTSVIGDRITKPQRKAIKKNPFGDWDGDKVINGLDCQPRNKKKHMARYSISQEKELQKINWNKKQKGKKIGEGHFAEVFEVKDNPKYVLKVPKDNQGSYHGSTREEMNKYEQVADNELIAPSMETPQGIVREKLNIVSRGATKQDWDNKDKRVNGYSFFEKNNITKNQANQVVKGVNELSSNNILIDDELQVGINQENKPYLYDLGTFRKAKYNNYDGYARDENDEYKKRFLEGVNQEDQFDRDYEDERKKVELELRGYKND